MHVASTQGCDRAKVLNIGSGQARHHASRAHGTHSAAVCMAIKCLFGAFHIVSVASTHIDRPEQLRYIAILSSECALWGLIASWRARTGTIRLG